MEILNLTSLLASDKKIVIGEREFLIPGSLSTSRMLKLMHHGRELQKDLMNPELMQNSFKVVHEIFQIKTPDLSYDEFEDMVTLEMLPQIISFIYNVNTPDVEKKTPELSETVTE